MRGVKFENLLAIVDFLYFGETNIHQELLDSFLAIAEELQLKGLMGRSPQICTVYLCVTLKNQIINPCSNANSLITRLVCVPTTTKTILGHLPDLL